MSGGRLASNAAWSLASQLLPLTVALVTIPLLLRAVGLERFGFLSIAWTLVGFAGLLDLGIRRAVTRLVAEWLGRGDTERAARVGAAALFMALGIGVLLCVIVELSADLLVNRWLGLPPHLSQEGVSAFRVLALSLPFVMLTNVYGGILAGFQRFKALGLVLMVMGLFNYLLPLVVTIFTTRLEALFAAVVATRLVTNIQDRKSTRLNSSHIPLSRMPSSA